MAASKPLLIYTDGSTYNNGQRGARGGWGIFFEHGPELHQARPLPIRPKPTNNRGELLAVIWALRLLLAYYHQTKGLHPVIPVPIPPALIFTDSKYVLLCWSNGKRWEMRRKDYPNRDLVRVLLGLKNLLPDHVELKKVRGHAKIPGNEVADGLARWGTEHPALTEAEHARSIDGIVRDLVAKHY